MSIVIADWETTTKMSYKRKANPFDKDNRVVCWGLRKLGKENSIYYEEKPPASWWEECKMFVACNAKFDLTWVWRDPDFVNFLKRGGKLWCVQYAEYLLSGQQHFYPSLDELSAKYGGELKNDEIKAMWEAGIDTPDIPQDMLIDYLHGDLTNTEIVYLGQIREARRLDMIETMYTHMEALLGLTEMEYNGLYINKELAESHKKDLNERLSAVIANLDNYIPELPDQITWNWGSKDHLSALIFGGGIKYKKQIHKQDEDGNYLYTKVKVDWPLVNGEPVDPETIDKSNPPDFDTYKSGKNKGKIKYKKVDVRGEPKTKLEDFVFYLDGYYSPIDKWKTKKEGVYKTDEEVLSFIVKNSSGTVHEICKLLLEWRVIDKDLGTYYERYDPKKKVNVGMLTLVQQDGLIHHNLNNVSTVTGRLSSSNPNSQNISSGRKSKVKQLFSSRFGDDGYVIESDFSQLEVIGKGFLCQDKNLIDDINGGVDFHIKRLANKLGEDYESVYIKCKKDKLSDYIDMRQDSKQYSFQAAYGAGDKAISESTGMDLETVKSFRDAENTMYPNMNEYDKLVEDTVLSTRYITDRTVEVDGLDVNIARGEYISPTGKKYVFNESPAPDFIRNPRWKKRGDPTPPKVNFKPTEMKNYPTQGFSGEIVLLCIGHIFREFLRRDNFGGKAFLINTVHDCIWVDAHKDVYEEAYTLVHKCLENADNYLTERYSKQFVKHGYPDHCNVKFRVETEVGKNMLELEEVHVH